MEDLQYSAPRVLGNVCVLGLGRTGESVARYLVGQPRDRVASVTLYGGASSYEGEATRALAELGVEVMCGTEQIEGAYDLAVVSPGIPQDSAFFRVAQAHAREVVGEPEFAWRESPNRWVAITGTNGKTTTTLLTTSLLQAGGFAAEAVGNVGIAVTGRLEYRQEGSWYVAELSSFQLATTTHLHPRVACLLNVTPDHVEWHGSMEAYAAAKEQVFQNLAGDDLAIISCEDAYCRAAAERVEARGVRVCHVAVHGDPGTACAAFVRDGRLVVRLDQVEHTLVACESMAIKGEHNWQNALCAAACALAVGVPEEAVSHGLMLFSPLEHRIEPCGQVDGVSYVDDSKATNVDSVAKALTAFAPGRVIVLLGGHDKGTELVSLAHAVSARCKVAVCYGEAGPRIAQALRNEDGDMGLAVVEAPHLAEALQQARELASSGDVVLLSPACSSFDEFANYHERGVRFKELVAAMRAGTGAAQ